MADITGVVLPREAALQLASFAINEMLESDEGCCPKCCGPCWAIKELMDQGLLDKVVKPFKPEDAYDWFDVEKGKVKAELITEAWAKADALGCHMTAG